MACGIEVLSESEKAVLRRLAHGHDVKSAAGELGISVHAVNERLRTARRKLAVSSSREAARLLAAAELQAPNSPVDKKIGVAVPGGQLEAQSQESVGAKRTFALAMGGLCTMLLVIMIAMFATASQKTSESGPLPNWTLQTAMPERLARASNRVHLSGNRLLWNGGEVSEDNIRSFLRVETQMKPQPLTIFTYSSQVVPGRIQRMRQLIDRVLDCTSATCLEVTSPVDDGGAPPQGLGVRSTH